MKVACGQGKSKTGSSMRSHANPRERQALSKGSSAYRLRAARRSGPLAFPCPWARPVHLPDGQPKCEDDRVPPPYLHRSAGCHGDGSRVYRNTCSCLCCFCTSADRGSRGIRQCLQGTRARLQLISPWSVRTVCSPLPLPLSFPPPLRALGDRPNPSLSHHPHSACQRHPPWTSPLLSILTALPQPGPPLPLVWRRAMAWCVSLCSSQAFCYSVRDILTKHPGHSLLPWAPMPHHSSQALGGLSHLLPCPSPLFCHLPDAPCSYGPPSFPCSSVCLEPPSILSGGKLLLIPQNSASIAPPLSKLPRAIV